MLFGELTENPSGPRLVTRSTPPTVMHSRFHGGPLSEASIRWTTAPRQPRPVGGASVDRARAAGDAADTGWGLVGSDPAGVGPAALGEAVPTVSGKASTGVAAEVQAA